MDSAPQSSAYAVAGQSAAEYAAVVDAIRSSALKQILITPAHYRYYQQHPKDETAAMSLGTALHAALLEADAFAEAFAVVPKVDRRTREGKQQWQAFLEAQAGKTLIPAADLDMIGRLRDAVARYPRARALLTLPGSPELSLYWTDPVTGIRLKARPDRLLSEPRRVLLEVKSTARADLYHFQKRIVEFDYHLSLAMYREGVRAVYGELPPPVFLVIETETFELCLYQPDADMLREGERRFHRALALVERCQATDAWPGYQPDGLIQPISLPRWVKAAHSDTTAVEY